MFFDFTYSRIHYLNTSLELSFEYLYILFGRTYGTLDCVVKRAIFNSLSGPSTFSMIPQKVRVYIILHSPYRGIIYRIPSKKQERTFVMRENLFSLPNRTHPYSLKSVLAFFPYNYCSWWDTINSHVVQFKFRVTNEKSWLFDFQFHLLDLSGILFS